MKKDKKKKSVRKYWNPDSVSSVEKALDLLDFFTRLSHTLRQNCQIQQKRRRPSWPFGPHFHSSTSSVFYGVVDFKTWFGLLFFTNATKQRCRGRVVGVAALAKLTGRLLLREHKVHDFPLNFRLLPYQRRQSTTSPEEFCNSLFFENTMCAHLHSMRSIRSICSMRSMRIMRSMHSS